MRHKHLPIVAALVCLFFHLLPAQINPQDVTITRDTWGVPHIHGKTDADAAYGLAWANAEDDFGDMQLNLLMARARQGEVKGKEGAIIDYAVQLLDVPGIIKQRYATDVPADFDRYLRGYVQGLNDYASAHPKEVLRKGVFPVQPQDVVAGYVMSLVLMEGVHFHFQNILDGRAGEPTPYSLRGSNGFAFNSSATTDGQVYLFNNSHQPLDGPTAWYEAHISSDEGLNVLGGLFPGGASVFAGANPNLAWMHTVNQPDLVDVYHLEMNPKRKGQYRIDGQWKDLKVTKAKLKLKVGPFMLSIRKKAYASIHGPVLKYKQDFYALRFPALHTIKSAEQWFAMCKARNYTEFHQALELRGLPSLNIVYADRNDTIFYIDNGLYPKRQPGYDWLDVLPGDTSAVVWETYQPLENLVQCLNPSSGYVYNTNNTPYSCSAPQDNPQRKDFDSLLLVYPIENNRSLRVQQFMDGRDKISYDEALSLKYNQQYPDTFTIYYLSNINCINALEPDSFPSVAEELRVLRNWDRRTNVENKQAALFIKTYDYLFASAYKNNLFSIATCYPAQHYVDALHKAGHYLRKHFGALEVPLGDFQRHVRGDQDWPIGGGPDVVAAMYSRPWRDGRKRSYSGESYIQLVRFSESGVQLRTVVPYGSSDRPDSKHFADQAPLFLQQQTKEESLDPEWVKAHAERVYHPGE